MARKKRKKSARRERLRPQDQRPGRRVWLQAHRLAIGVTALLLVLAVVGAVLLTLGRHDDSSQIATTDLDKSKGAADAPVVVVEYGDFQ